MTSLVSYTPLPIAPAALRELRAADDSGRPVRPFTAREAGDPAGAPVDAVGSPLRCCLRAVEPGERIALVSYAPLRRWAAEHGAEPGAYDEAGPVFVHAAECAGPAASAGYPFLRAGALRTVRRYDARGRIVGGRLVELTGTPDTSLDQALDEAFTDPRVRVAHVRAVEYGCFHFEVRRP
ncbi:DUF1203 domain-containing protein [Streptomyces sp. NPDC093085]|uniref:DUF1203 domain-containing protein n=1 Tax=Streptomyces sp. NPDC093085 TaxID=3155068 RepID=UPI00341214D1